MSELHTILTEALHKVQPVETWGNSGHEFKVLKEIEEKLTKLTSGQEEASRKGIEMLREFYRRRKAGDFKFKDKPFTPRSWKALWDDLVVTLEEQTEAQKLPGNVPVQEMFASIQIMYEKRYNSEMAKQIARLVGRVSDTYMRKLHDEVVRGFKPTATRPLPDVAEFNLAMGTLGQPETDAPIALPEPKMSDEERQRALDKFKEDMEKMYERSGKKAEMEKVKNG